MKDKYILGVAFYNEDEDMWEVKVGDNDMNLWYTVWGKTKIEAIQRAEWLSEILNNRSKFKRFYRKCFC